MLKSQELVQVLAYMETTLQVGHITDSRSDLKKQAYCGHIIYTNILTDRQTFFLFFWETVSLAKLKILE